MLATFRVPLLDGRGFVEDEAVATSVVLPHGWNEGEFVRGLGRITRRPAGITEPWAAEGAFVELGQVVKFPPSALHDLNVLQSDFSIQKVRKRAWRALLASQAILDIDVAFQLNTRVKVGAGKLGIPSADPSSLLSFVGLAAELPVRVRGLQEEPDVSLLALGKVMRERYATHTSRLRESDHLVGRGQVVAVIEAPGIDIKSTAALGGQRLLGSQIQLFSSDVRVPGGGLIRTHIIWDERGNKADRRRIRQLRIHILRLHSIHELFRFLSSPRVQRSPFELASRRSAPGSAELQRALLESARLVATPVLQEAMGPSLLSTAFFASRFASDDFAHVMERLLAQMRPKVASEIRQLIKKDTERGESEAAILEMQSKLQQHVGLPQTQILNAKQGIYIMQSNTFNVGSSSGIIGGVVSGNTIGTTGGLHAQGISISSPASSGPVFIADREALLSELKAFRSALGATAELTGGSADPALSTRLTALAAAEAQVEAGDSAAFADTLRAIGEWALDKASDVGVPILVAALKNALGLEA